MERNAALANPRRMHLVSPPEQILDPGPSEVMVSPLAEINSFTKKLINQSPTKKVSKLIQNKPKFIPPSRQPVVHFRPPEVQNVRLVVYSE